MNKMEKALNEWVSLGLINQEQATRIQVHESEKPESSWIMTGFLILGAVILGLGVISLVATNWQNIPDAWKLVADFGLLCLMAFGILRSWEANKSIQFEALLVMFLLLCLASIGLISQIYHTGGHLYQALLFWCFISLPAMLVARNLFLPFLWTGVFLGSLCFMLIIPNGIFSLFHKNYQAVILALPLFCASLTVVSKFLGGEIATTRAFRSWTIISGLLGILASEFQGFSSGALQKFFLPFLPGYIFAAFTAGGILISDAYNRIQKGILLATLFLYVLAFHLPQIGITSMWVYSASTILVMGMMAIFMASLQKRGFFHFLLFLMGLRFLVVYFQAFMGLALTGFGLIISGGLVIALAVLWNKYRSKIAAWAEGLAR